MPDDLRARQLLIEDALRRHLDAEKDCPPLLAEAMRYSLLAPGKRMRPILVLLSTEACGGDERKALPAACAVEMVHTYSLIHDDLPAMDDDDLRRGLPTCHKKFGEATAILAGDALLTLAFQVLASGYPPATACGCCLELARGAGDCGMVAGQALDLAWEAGSPSALPRNLESLERIHAQKTGALFRACLRLGAWSAQGERTGGPDRALLEAVDCFGRCLGMVFQITDDLLDVEGSVEQTGKRVGKDAARGKLTYPGLLGVEESRRRARDYYGQARGALAPLQERGDRLIGIVEKLLERSS